MKKWKLADVKESKATGNFEALFTIDNEDNGRSYVLYTDNSISEEGYVNVYASFFDAEKGTEELYPLEDILAEVEKGMEEGMEEEEMDESDFTKVD